MAEYLTVREVAVELKVVPRTIQRWIHDEGLPVVKLNRVVRVERQALDTWLASRANQPTHTAVEEGS